MQGKADALSTDYQAIHRGRLMRGKKMKHITEHLVPKTKTKTKKTFYINLLPDPIGFIVGMFCFVCLF